MGIYTSMTLFVILLLMVGCLVYIMGDIFPQRDAFDTMHPRQCPNLLLQEGERYFLYNSRVPTVPGQNPRVFSKLRDYADYVAHTPQCPVLFLQKSVDTQGKDTYTVRGGTPMDTWKYNGIDQVPPLANGMNIPTLGRVRVAPFVDANLQHPPYNAYNKPGYAPFDPYGFDIGRFNPLDFIHISGELLPVSDNPTDSNWGGKQYTEHQVNSGKYEGRQVYRPILSGGPHVTIR